MTQQKEGVDEAYSGQGDKEKEILRKEDHQSSNAYLYAECPIITENITIDAYYLFTKEISELKRRLEIAVEALDDAIRNIYGNDMHPFEVEIRMIKALAHINAGEGEK